MNHTKTRPGQVREVLAVALPMVVSMSCDTVMTFVNRLFVARLGSHAMNAVFSGGLTAFAFQTFFLGLIGYSTALVAQLYGAKQYEHCVLGAYQSILFALLCWPLALGLMLVGDAVFPLLGLPDSQLREQTRYFDWMMVGSLIGFLRGAFSGFFTGLGRTRVVMAASLISTVVNIPLVWVFVFGHFGLPALGVLGAAIGSLIASAIGTTILVVAFFSKGGARSLGPRPRFGIHRGLMGELIAKGSSSGAEFFLNILAFQGIVLLFQRHGEQSATAVSILFSWDMVTYVPLVGIEIGVTSLVGQYVGARNFAGARRALRSGLKLGWLISGAVLVTFLAFPGTLVDAFRGDPPTSTFLASRALTVDMIRLASLYVGTEAILVVFAGALRGAGDTLYTMLATVAMHWISLLVLGLSLEVFRLNALAGWTAQVAVFAPFPLVLWLRWRTGKWRTLAKLS